MIVLYQFARSWGIPNQSQFCVKTETYLRMAKLPYQIVEAFPFQGPKRKLPYIVDDGHKVADSRLILMHLQSTYGNGLDAHLAPETVAIAKGYQRLLEEHLYWIGMLTRWNYTEANWQVTKKAIFGGLPPVARDLAAAAYRSRIKGQIKGHGIGRLSAAEAFDLGREDLNALACFLADKPFFMGEQPSSLDASAFGILINTLGCPIESPLKDHALSKTNLVAYCQRMQGTFFPELPEVKP